MSHPLGQTHSLASSKTFFFAFLLEFEKWGRMDGQHVRKQLFLPVVTVGWPILDQFQVRIVVIAIEGTVGLTRWIIYDTHICLVNFVSVQIISC